MSSLSHLSSRFFTTLPKIPTKLLTLAYVLHHLEKLLLVATSHIRPCKPHSPRVYTSTYAPFLFSPQHIILYDNTTAPHFSNIHKTPLSTRIRRPFRLIFMPSSLALTFRNRAAITCNQSKPCKLYNLLDGEMEPSCFCKINCSYFFSKPTYTACTPTTILPQNNIHLSNVYYPYYPPPPTTFRHLPPPLPPPTTPPTNLISSTYLYFNYLIPSYCKGTLHCKTGSGCHITKYTNNKYSRLKFKWSKPKWREYELHQRQTLHQKKLQVCLEYHSYS